MVDDFLIYVFFNPIASKISLAVSSENYDNVAENNTPQNTDITSQLCASLSIIHKRSVKNEMLAPLGGT